MQQDSVDRHIEHWQREIPELDPLVEGVITRMQMLLRHLHQTRQATLADTYGLEEHEYATLHFLGGCGPGHRATPSEIAAWHKMSPSGITGRLDALEKRGYIRRLPSPTDRRKVIVELTEEGRQAWRNTFDPQTDEETRVLAALTAEEREQLNDMLRRMMRVVDRPGLLTTPRSAESAGAATEQRSRFTQSLLPCGARGKAARVPTSASAAIRSACREKRLPSASLRQGYRSYRRRMAILRCLGGRSADTFCGRSAGLLLGVPPVHQRAGCRCRNRYNKRCPANTQEGSSRLTAPLPSR